MPHALRWLAALLSIFTASAAQAADPDALWHLVHDRCAPGLAAKGDPAPCALVGYPQGESSGYAVLKDRNGAYQYLLIPAAKITGIEDPAILAKDATNYFAAAWRARRYFLARIGHELPRDMISLAINSPYGRSQNQLHIHIDCIDAKVRAAVLAKLAAIGPSWQPLGVDLMGHPYRARRLDSADLSGINPFHELAADPAVGPVGIQTHTLLALGATFPDGHDGFVLLDDRFDVTTGDGGSGEELQDHACTVAK